MEADLGVTWTHIPTKRASAALLIALILATVGASAQPAVEQVVPVIVRGAAGMLSSVERAVTRTGGTVGQRLEIIDGVEAAVPASSLDDLQRDPAVAAITPDRSVRLHHTVDNFDGSDDAGSLYNTTKRIRAQDAWKQGVTGSGVGVALIDSGVVPVDGLRRSGKVVNGPDLSFESQAENLRYLDSYGHGTHMAGIIAGRADAIDDREALLSHDNFAGVAPGAKLLSLKVAPASGATDVSQVIAAIDWVVQHRNDNGMNIRVLNLSFGTDGVQDYRLDPLSYAAEVAWRRGIVVVVAAGNSGFGSAKLNNPAYNPTVLAVGADDTKGTQEVSDDTVPAWSSRGDGTRNPDLVAPGKSIVGLRAPGSNIDVTSPGGRVNGKLFRGSGTSQASAVVSGAAALLLQDRPGLTPNQVKALLTGTAVPLPNTDAVAQGSGLINVRAAMAAPAPASVQNWELASGTGSLESARGSAHVYAGDVALAGEVDILGTTWSGTTWSDAAWNGTTWSGGEWNGTTWSGSCWCGTTWSGTTWSGTTWSGTTWSGTTWSGTTWSSNVWNGTTWSGTTWSGTTWSGTTWSGTTWSGTTWSGTTWSGAFWGDDAVGVGLIDGHVSDPATVTRVVSQEERQVAVQIDALIALEDEGILLAPIEAAVTTGTDTTAATDLLAEEGLA